MNLSKIRVRSNLTVIDLPIDNALPTDPYYLISQDGLGPNAVDVFIEQTIYQGGLNRGRRPQARQVVLNIGLNPNYAIQQSVGDLRAYVYGLLSAGDVGNPDMVYIQLFDQNGSLWGQIKGYVSKLDTDPFGGDTNLQITIDCLNSFIESPRVDVDLVTLNKNKPVITNVGSAPTGFVMQVTFLDNRTGWYIRNSANTKRMQFLNGFAKNDRLIIDTRPGFRKVKRIRGKTTDDLLAAMTSSSSWLTLNGGVNTFVTVSGIFNWNYFYYFPQHWGI